MYVYMVEKFIDDAHLPKKISTLAYNNQITTKLGKDNQRSRGFLFLHPCMNL